MKICIVGTGISGLVAAHHLQGEHELTIYESADWIGGHTHTVDVQCGARNLAVDTGFIVFNQATYPGFCALLKELGVPWQKSDMGFSVSCESTGLEYNGSDFNGIFAQRSNLLRPAFWGMLQDIKRFYREAPKLLEQPADATTLGEFLSRGGYSRMFVDKHLIPMGAAIWSATPETMRQFPLRFLVQFFHNHGFLSLQERPEWLVVQGGSREYVRRLVAPFQERIQLGNAVERIERTAEGVRVRTRSGDDGVFERVILATHADTSLRLLADPSALEREILGSFRFQRNEGLLHTDARLMPRRRRAWASWNYHVTQTQLGLPAVTYWMDNLQGLTTAKPLFLTLNQSQSVDPEKVLGSYSYTHPIFSEQTVLAQARHGEIDGQGGVHYCGAYWGYGFHEDGVQSALQVLGNLRAADSIEATRPA